MNAPDPITRLLGLDSTPSPTPVSTPLIGQIVRFDEQGVAVDFAGNRLGGPVLARSAVPFEQVEVGRDAVLMFDQGDVSRPIIMGVLQPLVPTKVHAKVDGERVVISADKEIVLQCGEASITLTEAGKILLRGAYLSSRSSGSNCIKGMVVEIN